MKKMFFIPVVAGLFAMNACKKTTLTAGHFQPLILPASGAPVIIGNNQFAFDLLHSTLQQDTVPNNKLISPLSIYMALSMLYNGAAHATADSIARVLRIPGLDIGTLNTICQTLITQMPKEDDKVQFSIANSIWYGQSMPQPLPSFLGVTQNYYDATVKSLNFADPGSLNTINAWAAKNTNNKITRIIDKLDPKDLMYLIDAIYFNGTWQYAFAPSDTYNDTFHLPQDRIAMTPFMKQEVTVNVVFDSAFTLAELPYGSGVGFSMYIALPHNPQQSISAFASSMNESLLSDAIGRMDSQRVQIVLPKWEYSYSIDDMRPELSALGMGIAFGAGADFSNLYDPSLVSPYVSKAIHKTHIDVNEAGTEAAAVTVIGLAPSATAIGPPVVKADHPFLYVLLEKQTKTVVFLGIVNDPGAH